MSFFADNRSRPRLPFDGAMGQEPPLKRLRSLLGVDPSVGDVGYGVDTALGFGTGSLSLAAYGRAFPDTSFLGGSDVWPLRTGLDEKILAASTMPTSLGSLGSLGMPSAAAAFIERNLPKLESPQMISQIDLGVAHTQPLSGLAGIQVPGLTALAHLRSKTKLCKHFIEGKCKFNEICNFAHSIEELKSMPGEGDLEGKTLVEKYRAKADAEKQAAGSGQDAISAGELKTKLCKHFIEGECKFKDGCHFAHSIQELKKLPDEGDDAGNALLERYKSKAQAMKLAAAGGELVQEIEPLPSASTGSTELKAKLCKHFIVGNCKYKESCAFAHSIEELKKLPGDRDGAGKALLEQYRSKSEAERPFCGHESVQTNETAEADAQVKLKPEEASPAAQKIQKPVLDLTGNACADAKVDDKSIRLMKTKMCKHFLVGACKYMDSCTFAHSIEELKPPAEAKDLVTKTTPTASVASPLKKSSTAIASADQHATLAPESSQQPDGKQNKDDKQGLHKTKACRFFLDGTCRFGHACTFLHGNEQIQVNGGTSQSGILQGPGELKATYKTRLCNMWEKDKTCTFGSKCHFAHGQEELRPRTGPSISGSSSSLYGCLEMEALSRAKQLGVPMSLPYSYEVTDTNWMPFRIAEEVWNGLGGGPNEKTTEMARGLLQNYGPLEQASSLASLSSLGGLNLGLASTNTFANLPLWQTR